MAPTPSSKGVPTQGTPLRTPQHKSRLLTPRPVSQPSTPCNVRDNLSTEHPVEVIGRIRDYPDRKEKPIPSMQFVSDGRTVRVRTDIGYRDFRLDGVSVAEEEDLDDFYRKFVESRVSGVRLGGKCTIVMYGPTGSGKSHTMFGCSKQPGIVYRALRDILGEEEDEIVAENNQGFGFKSTVNVTVLEIYNEEIYDLLSSNNAAGGLNFGWPKGNASKVRLEVMGKRAKNATFISGNEAGQISREVAKVEKRRIVKNTLCNERSSRSHCLIILDVPSVRGRLMLVDMAGSENIDQAGQIGFEAKLQTAKINLGNIALKRVVESIANGDSHVPFRDSKLTMLLQDSFEDDKAKILMILCASPDPKEMHKTIATLEYGAKAKCIVRASHAHTPKDKTSSEDSVSALLGSRIAAMNEFISKLQMENKLKEKEREEAHKELLKKEKQVAELRAKLESVEVKGLITNEEEINSKVNERTLILRLELEKKVNECEEMANDFAELGRRMEEKILQQQEEVEMLRQRLEEIESEVFHSRNKIGDENGFEELSESRFAKRLTEMYAEGEQGMEKSMDLDLGDQQVIHEVREICGSDVQPNSCSWVEEEDENFKTKLAEKVYLSTVFEGEEGEDGENMEEEEVEKEEAEEGENGENMGGEEVEKEVIIAEKEIDFHKKIGDSSPGIDFASSFGSLKKLVKTQSPNSYSRVLEEFDDSKGRSEKPKSENTKDATSARKTRIQNIFMLCGNHRELAKHVRVPPSPATKRPTITEVQSSPIRFNEEVDDKAYTKEMSQFQLVSQQEIRQKNRDVWENNKENTNSAFLEPLPSLPPSDEQFVKESQLNGRWTSIEPAEESKKNRLTQEETEDLTEVYVKWEASKEFSGKFLNKLKVSKSSSLADLRKLIETHLNEDSNKQSFTFLMLGGDPTGAPVSKEREAIVQVSKLPICHNQLTGHLACLRPTKKALQRSHLPFNSLENKLSVNSDSPSLTSQPVELTPKIGPKFGTVPYIKGL